MNIPDVDDVDEIDITNPEGLVIERWHGGEVYRGRPVDIVGAIAVIRRVCRGCDQVQSEETRDVRITSPGTWWDTKVMDIETGARITETFSVHISLGVDDAARAEVLANYIEPRSPFAALCPRCIQEPGRFERRPKVEP